LRSASALSVVLMPAPGAGKAGASAL
jgi:hypothetical protein